MTNKSWQLQYFNATAIQHIKHQPYCAQFDDVYFNDQGGIAETRFVFIEHNQLLERWQQNANQSGFCIAETGFGTGLNFLTTLQTWQAAKTKPHKLHFISCEKYPLSYQDMKQAHECFPELQLFSHQLLAIWSDFNDMFRSGFHTFQISQDVILTLALGDATDNLAQLDASVDAWFLDGFAPKKNPDMWHENLFAEVSRLSQHGTTLATFTAASQVSKALEQVGFEVRKKPGFGKKREMITAHFKQHKAKINDEHRWYPMPKTNIQSKSVTVLGGGIAGLCLAYYFKQSNYHVTVIEQNPSPMQGASGNDMAMVMPLLTAQQSPESAFYVRAFEHALRFYHANELSSIGVEQIFYQAKQQQWAKSIQQASWPKSLLQITHDSNALYPMAGYVDTHFVAERLKANVDQWLTAEVDQLSFRESGQWQLLDKTKALIANSELLIIANGIKAQQLMLPNDLSLTAKHGMTTTIEPTCDHILDHIQLAAGYVIPYQFHQRGQIKQQWLCGATFDHLDTEQWYQTARLHDDHWQRNLAQWQGHALFNQLEKAQVISGHAAIRATTADHLPICGPVIDQPQFKLDYHDLHHGRHWQQYPPAKALNNLYVLNGLGSRGFTSAPLLAQHLCAMIVGEPLPLEVDLCKIIHPNRFLYRSLKKTPKIKNNNKT